MLIRRRLRVRDRACVFLEMVVVFDVMGGIGNIGSVFSTVFGQGCFQRRWVEIGVCCDVCCGITSVME